MCRSRKRDSSIQEEDRASTSPLMLKGREQSMKRTHVRRGTFGLQNSEREEEEKEEEEEKNEKEEERVSGWFIESLQRRWIAEEGEQKRRGRLYSFQAQKLNLISNINLFSLRALSFLLVPFSFSSRSFPSICRSLPSCAPFLSA